jgi:hypothetical protein
MKNTNSIFILIILIVIPFSGSDANTNELAKKIIKIVYTESPQTKWDADSIVSADINCDNKNDYAIIGVEKNKVKLILILGVIQNSSKTITLEFGLGDLMSQSSLCGCKAKLKLESQDNDLYDALGENPVGYKKSDICKGLNIYDDMCDSFHIFWNHKTNTLNWWRL